MIQSFQTNPCHPPASRAIPSVHAPPFPVRAALPLLHAAHMTLQTSAEVVQPKRKKGKTSSRQGSDAAPALWPGDCIQAVFKLAQGVLAVGGDAARLLHWGAPTPALAATFSLAVALLRWSKDLHGCNPGLIL